MLRTAAHTPRTTWRALALALCLILAASGLALAKTAPKKAAKTQPAEQGETLPSAPDPAGASMKPQPASDAKSTDAAQSGLEGTPPPPDAVRGMTTIKQPADFNECVRVALVQSPLLVKSALEIESKRLDVQDAWSTFIPTVSINTTYWFRLPPTTASSTNTKPYTIGFSTSQWNPVVSGFEVSARKEMTNIAVLGHLKVIGEGLKRLAADFLQLAILDEQREVLRRKHDMAKMNLDFFKTRLSMGQATTLDVRMAESRLQMAKAEDDKLFTTRSTLLDDIKFILGVPFSNKLELNVSAAKAQSLRNYSPAEVTEDKVRAYSFDLRVQEYEKRLQKKNIGLSYVRLMPTFSFVFQTVDALSAEQRRQEKGLPFYPGISFSLPLDYWTKGRDIARQYKKMDQVNATTRAKDFELMVTVQKALSEYQGTQSDLALANARLDMAKIQDEQSEYRHRTGQVDFDRFMNDRNDFFEARLRQLNETGRRELALLNLKHLAGDLQSQFVDVASWEKEN